MDEEALSPPRPEKLRAGEKLQRRPGEVKEAKRNERICFAAFSSSASHPFPRALLRPFPLKRSVGRSDG